MSYYRTTFIVLAVILGLCVAGAIGSFTWRRNCRDAIERATAEAARAGSQRRALEQEERVRDDQVRPLRAFTANWEPHLSPAAPKETGNFLRNALATLATRTGLTSEGATVPAEARSYVVGGIVIRVQQLSMNVVSESLPGILTWLGAVEQQFPFARVESLTLSGYASRSVQLSVTLLQPVEMASNRVGAVVSDAPRKP